MKKTYQRSGKKIRYYLVQRKGPLLENAKTEEALCLCLYQQRFSTESSWRGHGDDSRLKAKVLNRVILIERLDTTVDSKLRFSTELSWRGWKTTVDSKLRFSTESSRRGWRRQSTQNCPIQVGKPGLPINAPGMGRFKLLNLGVLGYGLELRFWVVIAIIVSLTLTITLITTLTII